MAPSQKCLYLAALIACLTAALFGYSVGFIGGVLVLPSFLRHFHLNTLPLIDLAIAQSRIVSVWLVGALFGVPLGMPVCSRWGRRSCLAFSALLYVLGTVLQLINVGGNVLVFESGRLINGLGVGVGTLVSPMYISEISPVSERGMLMSGYQAVLQLSALLGFWGAYASHAVFAEASLLQWELPVSIQLIPGIFLVLGTMLVPETPRFLAERDQFAAAESALAWLRGRPVGDVELSCELDEIREAATFSKNLIRKQKSFIKEVATKSVRQRLFVGVGLMIAQNMVGLNALNYYAPVIFMSAGFTSVSSSLFLTGIFGVVKLVSAIAFMFFFVKMKGNLFWLKSGSLVCGASMLILAYFVRLLPRSNDLQDAKLTVGGVISILMVYIFAFSFSVSLGPISWNVCSEIFPLHLNAKCCTITTCTQWLFQIVIASITPRLLASVGWVTYVIYAVFCIISYIWISFCVPETRGVALGWSMDQVFGGSPADTPDEDSERTSLLRNEHRRSSIISLVA